MEKGFFCQIWQDLLYGYILCIIPLLILGKRQRKLMEWMQPRDIVAQFLPCKELEEQQQNFNNPEEGTFSF